MITIFSKYVLQNVLAMVGISVYILADTFFISMYAGADGLAVLNLILPLYGLIYCDRCDDWDWFCYWFFNKKCAEGTD